MLQRVNSSSIRKAKLYATELLFYANRYKDDLTYATAIHSGNIILGRIALKSDDLEKAREYLIRAGNTPGSRQLDTMGPHMQLAKELLERGEKDIVLKYFQLCADFWKSGKELLDDWTDKVKKGGTPDFGSHLYH